MRFRDGKTELLTLNMAISLTKTKLHSMGYRLSKSRDCYWKRRKIKGRGAVIVQVKLMYDNYAKVNCRESGELGGAEHSEIKGVRQLREWEKFAFCK